MYQYVTLVLFQDTSEVKRKSAKRTFKTEKEFLEFTLSYQKVLSERDAGVLFSFMTCADLLMLDIFFQVFLVQHISNNGRC